MPVQEQRQVGVEEGDEGTAVVALGQRVGDEAAVGGTGEQPGDGHDVRVLEPGGVAAHEGREELVAGGEVGALVGEQDGAGEAGFPGDDLLEQPLADLAVEEGAGLDGASVAQAQGGGGQRQLEVDVGVVEDGDGPRRQRRRHLQPGLLGEVGVVLQAAGAQRGGERGAGREGVDGQRQVVGVEAGEAEGAGGGPPVRQLRARAGDGLARQHQPAQREGGVEFGRVGAQFGLGETGAGPAGGVDGVVAEGGEGVVGRRAGHPGPVGGGAPVRTGQAVDDLLAHPAVQPGRGEGLLALGEEGVEAGPVLRGGGRAQPGQDRAQSAHRAVGGSKEGLAGPYLALETVRADRQQQRFVLDGESEPGAVGVLFRDRLAAQLVGVLAQEGAEDAAEELVLHRVGCRRAGCRRTECRLAADHRGRRGRRRAHEAISQRREARKSATARSIRSASVPVARSTPR